MASVNEMPEELRTALKQGAWPGKTDEVAEQAWRQILVGDDDLEEFCEYIDADEREELGVDEATLSAVFNLALTARRKQLAALSDEERTTSLSQAFDELETQGIIARQNFSCCGTCASGEIYDERSDDKPSRGYVYFHAQDAESLVEDRSTYIGYGAFVDGFYKEDAWNALNGKEKDAAYERITVELMSSVVVPTLERHGIKVSWDGQLAKRILLDNVDFIAEV